MGADRRPCKGRCCGAHCPTNEQVVADLVGKPAGTRVLMVATNITEQNEVYLTKCYDGGPMLDLQVGRRTDPRSEEWRSGDRVMMGIAHVLYAEPLDACLDCGALKSHTTHERDCPNFQWIGTREVPELVHMVTSPIVEFRQPTRLAVGYTQDGDDPSLFTTPAYSSLRWTNLDGMLHVATGACCGCDYECPRCGGLLHKQGVHGGMAYCCEACNAKDWLDPPQPLHDNVGIIITKERTQ